MLKSEVFEKALQEVVAQTEISRERILSQETCVEVVDARHILMYIMHSLGFYPRQIAELMNCTPSNSARRSGSFTTAFLPITSWNSTSTLFPRAYSTILRKFRNSRETLTQSHSHLSAQTSKHL